MTSILIHIVSKLSVRIGFLKIKFSHNILVFLNFEKKIKMVSNAENFYLYKLKKIEKN